MEAGTPQPAPPPPPTGVPSEAGAGWRAGAILLGLIFAFACAVMVVAMVDIGDTPRCDDAEALREAIAEGETDCFEGSSLQKTIALILGWPSAVLAGLVLPAGIAFAVRGRGGRLLLALAGAAIALGVVGIGVGSI